MIYGTHPSYSLNDMDAYRTFRDLDLTVEQCCRSLEKHLDEFDSIIVTGISGLVVGSPVALRLKKRLLVLRKEGENCHQLPGMLIGESDLTPESRILFLDDLVASGETRAKCAAAIKTGRIVAEYMYEGDYYYVCGATKQKG